MNTIDGITYPTVLRSYKDKSTYRVCSFQDPSGETRYGCAHPGHRLPAEVDYLADCPTLADAHLYAVRHKESQEALERL
jgi:hypothetical protein